MQGPLEGETSCVPVHQPPSDPTRSVQWSETSSPGTSSLVTHWVSVNWTTSEVGKAVRLTRDAVADPPRVGVKFTNAGNEQYDWVSERGTLTIRTDGTGGHVTATLIRTSSDTTQGQASCRSTRAGSADRP